MTELRRAAAADLPAVRALVEAAYAHYVPRLGVRPAPMDDDHAGHVRRGEQWVAVGDGELAGTVVLAARADHLWVDNLAVHPSRQGQGLGRALLELAEAQAREHGLPEVRLTTNAGMTESLALYAHLGYEQTGREQVGVFHRIALRKPVAQSGD